MLRKAQYIPLNTHKKSIFAIACSNGWPLPFGMGKLKKTRHCHAVLKPGRMPLKKCTYSVGARAEKGSQRPAGSPVFQERAEDRRADAQRSVRPASFLQLFACRPIAALAPRGARPDTPQLWHGTRCSICLNTQKPPE